MTPRHVRIGDITSAMICRWSSSSGRTRWNRAATLEISAALAEIARKLEIELIYKTSFDKANRSSLGASAASARSGLPILAEVRERTACRC
jgi:2-dehydro-3-deoxyphosphooctonate aldolase (KDO 8-P synthase)